MARLHVSEIKVIFLMMDPKYTTISNPPIDGWLSFFVGTETGYPLWDRLMVITTTREISKHVGENCKSLVAQSIEKVIFIELSDKNYSGPVDYATAWSILTNAIKARYHKVKLKKKKNILAHIYLYIISLLTRLRNQMH